MSNNQPRVTLENVNEKLNEKLNENDTTEATPTKTNPVAAFVQKHKTWFIVAGAATAGFILHGFLGREDDCIDDCDVDYDDLDDDTSSEDDSE